MRVTRRKEREIPLAEYPGWAVEVMMGLYGEKQVSEAIAAQTAPGPPAEAVEVADLDAVESVFARVRAFRRGRLRRG
ncbi:hypothetical protein [Williamsia deligens]|uniref:Uncharacterized protein n=1 Tax=Williamsia deligens TaxID=321325 RepID=A0ABW3G657_9NOCA|nr:hypothetical protein [Williamsia deligens]